METIYDWLTLACFSGLILLFLQRSMAEEVKDKVISYLPPALGCAVANYLGNEGHAFAAIALLAATVGYIIVVLKPLQR